MEKAWVTSTSRKSLSQHVMLAGTAKARIRFTFVSSTPVPAGSAPELSLCPKHSLTCSLNPRSKVYAVDQVYLTLTPFPTQKSDVLSSDPGNERSEDNNPVGHGRGSHILTTRSTGGMLLSQPCQLEMLWLLLKSRGGRCWASPRSQLTCQCFRYTCKRGFYGMFHDLIPSPEARRLFLISVNVKGKLGKSKLFFLRSQ